MEQKIIIQRLWHGYCSLRDYIVLEAIKKNKDLVLILKDSEETMTIPWNELDKGQKSPQKFKSKHNNNQEYYLIDYKWVKDDRKQPKLL